MQEDAARLQRLLSADEDEDDELDYAEPDPAPVAAPAAPRARRPRRPPARAARAGEPGRRRRGARTQAGDRAGEPGRGRRGARARHPGVARRRAAGTGRGLGRGGRGRVGAAARGSRGREGGAAAANKACHAAAAAAGEHDLLRGRRGLRPRARQRAGMGLPRRRGRLEREPAVRGAARRCSSCCGGQGRGLPLRGGTRRQVEALRLLLRHAGRARRINRQSKSPGDAVARPEGRLRFTCFERRGLVRAARVEDRGLRRGALRRRRPRRPRFVARLPFISKGDEGR